MDVRQLELFLAVLQHSSLTKAAESVHLSPGAISVQLHNLASDLRTELFVRSGRRFLPTPSALRLAELAEGVVRQMHEIEQEFGNETLGDSRPFHFATGGTALIHQLGRPLRLLRKKFPNTPVEITIAGTEEMVSGLLDRRFDLALISLPLEEPRLKIVPLLEEEMLIVKPSSTPVGSRHVNPIQPEELAAAPFLMYPKRSVMRTLTDIFFREVGVTPHVAMEVDDAQAIKRLVEAGCGYAVLSEHALRGSPRFFHMFRVPGHRIVRQQALASVHSDHPRVLTDSITRFLQSVLVPAK